MIVAFLSEAEKDQLVGQEFAPFEYFNPVQDIDNNWVISMEEVNNCINPTFMWVKDLPEIDYIPKPEEPIE